MVFNFNSDNRSTHSRRRFRVYCFSELCFVKDTNLQNNLAIDFIVQRLFNKHTWMSQYLTLYTEGKSMILSFSTKGRIIMYEMLPEVAVHVLTMDNQLPVSDKHYQVQNCLFLRFNQFFFLLSFRKFLPPFFFKQVWIWIKIQNIWMNFNGQFLVILLFIKQGNSDN